MFTNKIGYKNRMKDLQLGAPVLFPMTTAALLSLDFTQRMDNSAPKERHKYIHLETIELAKQVVLHGERLEHISRPSNS